MPFLNPVGRADTQSRRCLADWSFSRLVGEQVRCSTIVPVRPHGEHYNVRSAYCGPSFGCLTFRSHTLTTEQIVGRREDHPYIRLHQALTSSSRLTCT